MDMKRIPLCNKCANAILEEFTKNPRSLIMVGCKEDSRIKNYNDASKLCPVIKKDDERRQG